MLEGLRLLWHRWATRRKMNRVFSRGRDPYRYQDSAYERQRLEGMREALRGRTFKRALEIGSAEGVFTASLAGLAEQVTGLELSPVALSRARAALADYGGVEFFEADVRVWEPAAGGRFDLIVLGDVLYYMDKPLVRDEFERVFARLAGWLVPGGLALLAHGFAGEAERALRRGYRERFERLGLALESEIVLGRAEKDGDVCCLLSLLRRP
ncbi:MAG: SAM-dependent methyltransferase [Elusimicrobiota bacterium]